MDMFFQKWVKSPKTLTLSLVLMLSACGQENDVKEYNTTQTSGQFIDAPVGNLDVYQSGLKVATTDANGYFKYTDGIKLTFKLGKLTLGSTQPKKIITPLNLSSNRNDVIEILVALQSLDEDNNPNNGIFISDETKKKLKTSLNLSINNVTIENSILKDIPNLKLVKKEKAINHFVESAKQYNISTTLLNNPVSNNSNSTTQQSAATNTSNNTSSSSNSSTSNSSSSNSISNSNQTSTSTTSVQPCANNGASNSLSSNQGCNTGFETE